MYRFIEAFDIRQNRLILISQIRNAFKESKKYENHENGEVFRFYIHDGYQPGVMYLQQGHVIRCHGCVSWNK